MTVSSLRPPVHADSPDAAFAIVRREGLRLSAARRSVLKALFAAKGPITAEEIAAGTELELTSVYRNLEAFEEIGLVRHVHLGHGAGRYALARRAGVRVRAVRGAAATPARSRRPSWTACARRSARRPGSRRASATSRSSASAPRCRAAGKAAHAHP